MVRKQGRKPSIFREGYMSENRIMWLETFIGQFVVLMYPEGFRDESDDVPAIKTEPGPTIRLMIPGKTRQPVYFTFTALTSEELASLRELFNRMFDMVEPIVEHRDKAAQDAYDQGDDTITRLYRQVPRLIVREGAIREHSISLRERPSGPPAGHGTDGSDDGGLRGGGSDVVDEPPSGERAEDDQSSAD